MNNKVYNNENIPGARDVSCLEPPRTPLLLSLAYVGLRWLSWGCGGCRGAVLAFVGLPGLVW